MPTLVSRRAILLSIPAVFAVSGVASAGFFMRPVPDNLDVSLTRTSEGGLYQAALSPETMPVGIGQMHTWSVMIQTTDGAPVTSAVFAIDGGMPQHGHGLPTAPQITKNLGEGRYQIEGVKFNMGGWWTFEIAIDGAAGADVVIFNLIL